MWSKIKHRYHKEWQFISNKIKYERAKNRCETCMVPNESIIRRRYDGTYIMMGFKALEEIQNLMDLHKMSEKQALKLLGLTKVVLTVAHLDWNEQNNDEDNLKCLCQYHHLKHDRNNNLMRRISKKRNALKVINLFDDNNNGIPNAPL